MLTWPATAGPYSCSLDDQFVQYSAKRGLQRKLRTPQGNARESKTCGPSLGIQVLGLAIDSETRQPHFCLETDFMPALKCLSTHNAQS